MSWEEELDPEQRAEWDRFVTYQREHTLKMMDESAFVCSLIPKTDEFDVKFAVETGMAIMLDKPILAVVAPGASISGKLAKVADLVVYADLDTEEGRVKVAKAIEEMKGEP
jgi:hypothetical protein